jgi:hypothetical protein
MPQTFQHPTTQTPKPAGRELTHEEKWADVDAWLEEGRRELIAFYWKRAGRPHGPDRSWLPEDLR